MEVSLLLLFFEIKKYKYLSQGICFFLFFFLLNLHNHWSVQSLLFLLHFLILLNFDLRVFLYGFYSERKTYVEKSWDQSCYKAVNLTCLWILILIHYGARKTPAISLSLTMEQAKLLLIILSFLQSLPLDI